MKVLSPLGLVCCWQLASAAELNHTLDDINPLVVYDAPVLDRNITGFFPSEVKDGTVTHIVAPAQHAATISMNFTGETRPESTSQGFRLIFMRFSEPGTAVYVFVAYPNGFRGNESTTPNGFLAQIDGVPSGGWARGNVTAPLSGFVAYQNTTLSNNLHKFVIEIQPGWEVYFDCVKYTSFVPDSTSMSSSAATPTTSNLPASAASKTTKKVPVGAIAGGVIGGLFLLALVATPFILRRRAQAKKRAISRQPPVPYIIGPDDGRSEADKSEGPPTPVLPQSPPPGRRFKGLRSPLTLGIPTTGSAPSSTGQSPLSATSDPGLLLVAEEVRRLTASVQRLETGVSDDGRPIWHGPPAYYSTDEPA